MFDILSHKGNINQDNTEISHPSRSVYYQESRQEMLVRVQRKNEHLQIVGM
jgi:hypothetical protein